jgi:hypothetical protein
MYEVRMLPSMTKGDIVGHIVIDVLSLMSTVDDAHEDQKGKHSEKHDRDQNPHRKNQDR